MVRTLVLWCPDWPLTAAAIFADQPAAVFAGEQVTACTAAARASGVRIGLRRREAQSRCPMLTTVEADPARDARAFQPVVSAAQELVPTLEVVRPGLMMLAARGPSRVFGGEHAVASALAAAVDQAVAPIIDQAAATAIGHADADHAGHAAADVIHRVSAYDGDVAPAHLQRCHLGVADTRFAALVAARQAATNPATPAKAKKSDSKTGAGESGTDKNGTGTYASGNDAVGHDAQHTPVVVVPPGEDAAFLAEQPVQILLHGLRPDQDPEPWRTLVGLLNQLGLYTLRDFAALPTLNVADRFGTIGTLAHRWARGLDDQQIVPLETLPELAVRIELDEPASLVEAITFAVRRPAETLIEQLARSSLTCALLTIEVQTEHAEQLTRRWRTGGFTPALVVDRVRWQLDGWISGSAGAAAPTAGVVLVRLDPTEVIEGGSQSSLLDRTAPTAPVMQAITRLQGMLGPDAVLVGAPNGGRDPARWVTAVPWDESLETEAAQLPWPGRLPSPAPATVLPHPVGTEVIDRDQRPVTVSGRGAVSAAPWRLRLEHDVWQIVTGWAGPWPADERWWEATGRRRARFQIATEVGVAYLLALQDGRWQTEAIYD